MVVHTSFTFTQMTIGPLCGNVDKSFSELKMVTNNLSLCTAANWEATERIEWWHMSQEIQTPDEWRGQQTQPIWWLAHSWSGPHCCLDVIAKDSFFGHSHHCQSVSPQGTCPKQWDTMPQMLTYHGNQQSKYRFVWYSGRQTLTQVSRWKCTDVSMWQHL